tara:strand:+ start:5132 stop:6262 length:1131 start_codon:yes stop_codon:yes gene_type:complete
MEYVPPLNGDTEDPDRPWVDANPGASQTGSRIAAKGIEHPMREVVSAIAALGGTPDGEVLTQLGSAIVAYVAAQILASGASTKVAKAGDTMTGALNMSGAPINDATRSNLASSATPNLGGTSGNSVDITGNAGPITGFLGGLSGWRRLVRFTDAAPAAIVSSGTLQMPGGVSFQPAQYDQLEFLCNSANSWTCIRAVKWNGTSAIARVASTTASGESELADGTETAALTDATRAVTPLGLASLVASTTQKGLALLASTANVDTGTDTAKAVTPAALAGSKRTVDAWVNFTGATGAINRSLNVSSVTRNSAGNYTVNYTNNMASAFSAVTVTAVNNANGSGACCASQTAATAVVRTYSTTTAGSQDMDQVSVEVCGA